MSGISAEARQLRPVHTNHPVKPRMLLGFEPDMQGRNPGDGVGNSRECLAARAQMTMSNIDACHGDQPSQAHAPQKRCREAVKDDLPVDKLGEREAARHNKVDLVPEGGLTSAALIASCQGFNQPLAGTVSDHCRSTGFAVATVSAAPSVCCENAGPPWQTIAIPRIRTSNTEGCTAARAW